MSKAMMIAAMRGDLGPWAQAVARYQMEEKLRRALEKYGLSSVKELDPSVNSIKNTENKGASNEWLSKWSQGLTTDPAEAPPEKVPSRKPLPHVNRMRVVGDRSSESEKNKAQDDLNALKKLFGNANETESSR